MLDRTHAVSVIKASRLAMYSKKKSVFFSENYNKYVKPLSG